MSSIKKLLDNKFWFSDGCTATATATRNDKRSSSPDGRPGRQYRTQQSAWLHAAKNDSLEDYERLRNFLADQITAHALTNKWHLRGRERALAEIALYPYVNGIDIRTSEAARKMGITRNPYMRHWQPKIKIIDKWVRRWGDG